MNGILKTLPAAGPLSVGLLAMSMLFVATAAAQPTDLSIIRIDGQVTYARGQLLTYAIVARNNGLQSITGARVKDLFDATIFHGVSWACGSDANVGTCGKVPGIGHISNVPVNLSPNASVTAAATTAMGSASWPLVEIANINRPSGNIEYVPGNASGN